MTAERALMLCFWLLYGLQVFLGVRERVISKRRLRVIQRIHNATMTTTSLESTMADVKRQSWDEINRSAE